MTVPVRVAVSGKGGAGKSVIAGTLARVLARGGERVLALDSDLMPGLELSLGVEPPAEPPLLQVVEKPEEGPWRLRKGVGPVRAVRRCALRAPDGVLLLQAGKLGRDGLSPIMPAVRAYYQVIHRVGRAPAFSDWSFVGDLPAGPRQIGFDWAPFAHLYLVVVEPTAQSALTARRTARIARMRGAPVLYVANKVAGPGDRAHVERLLGERVVAALPRDAEVADAERLGEPPLDHAPGAPAVGAIESLAAELRSGTLFREVRSA